MNIDTGIKVDTIAHAVEYSGVAVTTVCGTAGTPRVALAAHL